MNQSELLAVTRKLIKAGENSRVQGVSWPCFGFCFSLFENSPLSQGGHIAPGDQKSFVLPR